MSSQAVHVGDDVRFNLAGRKIMGKVREDRGPIGVGGRHLYQILYELGKDNWYAIEIPLDQIEVIEHKKEPA